MAIVRKYQNNFTTGELSPAAYARVDLAKYASGCKRIVNGVVHAHGGISNRPGTRFVDELKGPGLLIPFTYSGDQAYVLAFFDRNPAGSNSRKAFMRIYCEAGAVVRAEDDVRLEIETPYRPADLPRLKFVQSADTLFLAHPAYPPYKLVRHSHVRWIFSELNFFPAIPAPCGLACSATGFSDPSDTYVATTVDYKVSAVDSRQNESVPSVAVTADTLSTWPTGARVRLSWEAVPGADHYEVYKNARGYYAWIGSAETNHFTDDNIDGDSGTGPKENRDPFNPAPAPDTAEIQLVGGSSGTARLVSLRVASLTESGVESVASETLTQNLKDDLTFSCVPPEGLTTCRFYWAYVAGGTARDPDGDVWYYQDAVMPAAATISSITVAGHTSSGSYHTYEVTMAVLTGDFDGDPDAGIAAPIKTFQLRHPDAGWGSDGRFKVTWPEADNASGYRIYLREEGGTEAAWRSLDVSGGTVTERIIRRSDYLAMQEQTVDTPNWSRLYLRPGELEDPPLGVPLDEPNSYPGAVGIYQQRLVLGRTDQEPQTVWLSEVGSFDSMAISNPMRDDNAIVATADSRQMNEIRHFVTLRSVLTMTSGAEFQLSAGRNSDAVTPTTICFTPQSYWGCSEVPPIVAGNSVVFVENAGLTVRDLRYQLSDDGYTGEDVSILASHLLDSPVADWAYQRSPWSTIWICLESGRLLTFTYLKEQEVWAWSAHESGDAKFLSAAVIREGKRDNVYFLTERFGGSWFIEFQEQRDYGTSTEDCFFVDCGSLYEGEEAVTRVNRLEHLAGQEVVVLADGAVVRTDANGEPLRVADSGADAGSLTLPEDHAARKILVGLGYRTLIETLDPEIKAQEGTTFGMKKNIPCVTLYLRESRGLLVGPDEDHLVALKPPVPGQWDDPLKLADGPVTVTIPGSHREEATVVLVQNEPLPMTILSLALTINVG